MKAKQSFEVILDKKGNRVNAPYYDGDKLEGKKLLFKEGDQVPEHISHDLSISNPELLEETKEKEVKEVVKKKKGK